MRSPYLDHFESFILVKLTSPESTFTTEDMVDWVQKRDGRRDKPEHARNIVEHLLKRVTNYDLRDDNDPPSRTHNDLFFMLGPNRFRRYLPEKHPPPFHPAAGRELARGRGRF